MAVAGAAALWTMTAHAQEPVDPPAAEAQARSRPLRGLAVGVGLDKIATTSARASNPWAGRFAYRLPPIDGWAPALIFGWFDTEIDGTQFGRDEHIGQLQVRPVMAGVRYTWLRDPWSHDVAAAAGVSFSDFDLDGDVAARLGAESGRILADASTSVAYKVQATTWYDLTDRVAIRGAVGVFVCRPQVTVTSGGTSRRFTQPATSLQLGASIVYRIF